MAAEGRTEKVYILFGSQTGNSEQAAEDIGREIVSKCSQEIEKQKLNPKQEIVVEPHVMQLDDFLELDQCQWTRLIIIVTSSYGVGMAPLGCYRFRDLCDAWMSDEHKEPSKDFLKGVQFVLCGLGDSKYTTFFENPTKIDKALHYVGARRVGPLGKADASGTGADAQPTVIQRWIDQIWEPIAKVVVQDPLPEEQLAELQKKTVALCRKINPDFPNPDGNKTKHLLLAISLLVALCAVGLYQFQIKNDNSN